MLGSPTQSDFRDSAGRHYAPAQAGVQLRPQQSKQLDVPCEYTKRGPPRVREPAECCNMHLGCVDGQLSGRRSGWELTAVNQNGRANHAQQEALPGLGGNQKSSALPWSGTPRPAPATVSQNNRACLLHTPGSPAWIESGSIRAPQGTHMLPLPDPGLAVGSQDSGALPQAHHTAPGPCTRPPNSNQPAETAWSTQAPLSTRPIFQDWEGEAISFTS